MNQEDWDEQLPRRIIHVGNKVVWSKGKAKQDAYVKSIIHDQSGVSSCLVWILDLVPVHFDSRGV